MELKDTITVEPEERIKRKKKSRPKLGRMKIPKMTYSTKTSVTIVLMERNVKSKNFFSRR